MSDLRKAAEMALEALELGDDISAEQMSDALEALRQALAMKKFSEVNQQIEEALKQPKWVGLTDEERQEIVRQEVHWSGICRAIEAKLKEKNKREWLGLDVAEFAELVRADEREECAKLCAVEIDDGGPAFPSTDTSGMSLRDYFAAKAIQGMLANPKFPEQLLKAGQSWIEESAWAVSDAMLDARNSKSKLLAYPVNDLDLDVRTLNCLQAEGIKTIGELCDQHTYHLKKVPNLGKVCLKNIVNALAKHGLKLKS